MSRRLPNLTHAQAINALEGRICFSGQNRREPEEFAAMKKAQGLRTRITAVGGRACLGQGDHMGTVTVSFWVPSA